MSGAGFEPGARIECARPHWWSAYGERFEEMRMGMRATVTEARTINGQQFVALEEFPDVLFWAAGFKRRLDG